MVILSRGVDKKTVVYVDKKTDVFPAFFRYPGFHPKRCFSDKIPTVHDPLEKNAQDISRENVLSVFQWDRLLHSIPYKYITNLFGFQFAGARDI